MTTKANFEKTLALIEENDRQGKVTFMTMCGPMTMPMEKFCRQSADGLLFDLNRDEVATVALGAEGFERWVNDYASAKVIRYLVRELEKARRHERV